MPWRSSAASLGRLSLVSMTASIGTDVGQKINYSTLTAIFFSSNTEVRWPKIMCGRDQQDPRTAAPTVEIAQAQKALMPRTGSAAPVDVTASWITARPAPATRLPPATTAGRRRTKPYLVVAGNPARAPPPGPWPPAPGGFVVYARSPARPHTPA